MVAFDETGNAVQIFNKGQDFCGHLFVVAFFKLTLLIFIVKRHMVGNGQCSETNKVRIDLI